MQIVIVGAGQAGAALASKLRSLGYTGKLVMIGDERAPPYQRPPLSKAYLLGEMPQERLWLRPQSFWDDHGVELRLGVHAQKIDRAAKTLTLSDSTVLDYDHLALTTGSTPRRLPSVIGGDLECVFTLRGLTDVDKMRSAFTAGKRLLVVGGGYIGLEAAAVARKLGLDVTLIEQSERILQRVAAAQTSDYFRVLHRAHGVDIRESTGLERLIGDTQVKGAVLSNGAEIAADLVIAGIGVTPNTALAAQAGLDIYNGIAVNAKGNTSDAAIWAAGDCASFPWNGQRVRIESVGNAIDQAESVAANILGADQDYIPKPWFWSDQYDCKLQIVGLNTGYDSVVARNDPQGGASFWYYNGAKLLAVDAMNDPRAYMVGKRLIESGISPDAAAIPTIQNLKELLA